MTDQGRTDFIRALESARTYLEAVESDFMQNKLHHVKQENNVRNCFQVILNSLEVAGDKGFTIDQRIQDLQGSLFNISSTVREKVEKRILFSNRAVEEINYLFKASNAILKTAIDFLRTDSPILIRWLENRQKECKKTCDECATSHEERLIEGICVPAASVIYLDMLHGFAGIHWQVVNMMWSMTGSRETHKVNYGSN